MRFPFALRNHEFKYFSNLKVKFAIGFIGVVVLAAASTAAFRSRRPVAPIKAPVVPAIQQTSSLEARAKSSLEVLPVQLKPQGFVPQQITRPAGDFLFSVSNQSGVAEIDLRLGRENGARLHEARLKRERLRWRQQVRLTPGTYLLTEPNHPTWVCRIVITAR